MQNSIRRNEESKKKSDYKKEEGRMKNRSISIKEKKHTK